MVSTIKPSLIYFSLFTIILSIGCNNTSEPFLLQESTDTYSNEFSLSSTVEKIKISNPIGFTFLNGRTDMNKVKYVLDRTVHAKTKSLAQSELSNIVIDHFIIQDTLLCGVSFPENVNNIYECNVNVDVPYNKDISIGNSNSWVHTTYLNSNLEVETNTSEIKVEKHTGSFEAKSLKGNITAEINISENGYCKCLTETGDIHVKIPINTSANIVIYTTSGSISYSNLDLLVESNSVKELKAKLGSGTGNIFLESSSGKIILEGI